MQRNNGGAVIKVPFGDLARQYRSRREEYDAALHRVLERGWFVLGEEGRLFEAAFAAFVGAKHCVACNSGTDAIHLALAAHGIGSGDCVITAANTCVPTAVGIAASGARLRLCDVLSDCALMDPASLDAHLRSIPCRAIVPVHLYGQSADLDSIAEVASRHGAIVVEDAAQAHGARYKGSPIGSHGNSVAWSFYPSKNLGCFGDGGAVTTHDDAIAQQLVRLRNYGQSERYRHDVAGTNSRLDELQAAVLRTRLQWLEQENARRREIAERYRREIKNSAVQFVGNAPGSRSCEHLFPVVTDNRAEFMAQWEKAGVHCLIHYPIPIHLQPAYTGLGYEPGSFPTAESLCSREVSLPLFPEMTDDEVGRVIDVVNGRS